MAVDLNQIKQRLNSLGYEPTSWTPDETTIAYLMGKVENHIFNFCNMSELPEGLEEYYIDAICGEFLSEKRGTGKLGMDIQKGVKTMTIGDTSVTYGDKSSSELLDAVIAKLTNRLEVEMLCYRQMKW